MKDTITFFEHELTMSRAEKKNRRLWITSLILTGALFTSNLYWIVRFFG